MRVIMKSRLRRFLITIQSFAMDYLEDATIEKKGIFKRMKRSKFILSATAFALLLSFGLAACGGGGEGEGSKPTKSSQPAQEKITITAADGKNKLILGETVQLTASVAGVTWSSSKTDVATISDAGLVTSVSKGSTQIKAVKDGYKDGSITITVDYENITISMPSGEDAKLLVNETLQLTADKQGVTWASSDTNVATVSDAGLVTAIKYGKTTITASGNNLNSATLEVSVVRPDPTAVLHMEDAEHFAADGEWSSSNNPTEAPTYNKSNASDGTTCAHFGAGDMETIRFTSSKAVKAEICLTIGYYYSLDDVSQILAVKFNGADITYPAQGYEAEDTSNYTYKPISFGELDLIADTNVLEITVMANSNNRFPYMDDLQIYAAEPVTITLVPAPQKDPVVVDQESVSVKEGKTFQITSTMTGLSYKSASESVATVSDTGLVTGVKVGTTAITITKDGYKALRLPVTVNEAEGVIALGINEGESEGNVVKTRTSQNLSAPYNYIVDEWPEGAILTFNFTVELTGAYNLYMKARASGGYNSTTTDDLATCMELKVNGSVVTLNQTVSGSFTEYNLGVVNLTAGPATMTIEAKGTVPTINMFRFVPNNQ